MKRNLTRILGLFAVLAVTLVVGITGAWYTASRTASGIIQMADGIALEYANLTGSDPYYLNFTGATNGVVSNKLPGDSVTFASPTVKLAANSANAYFRFKVTYEYSTNAGTTWTASTDPATLGVSALLTVSSSFIKTTSGNWYYYKGGNTVSSAASYTYDKMANLPANNQTAVSLFTSTNLTMNAATTSRKDIRVSVVMQAVQANQAGFVGESWGA